jgi:hypothetical protein
MVPHKRELVTLVTHCIELPMKTLAAQETVAAGDPSAAASATSSILSRVHTETERLRQGVAF